MIILKEGIKDLQSFKCSQCGCEFVIDMNDKEDKYQTHTGERVACPKCYGEVTSLGEYEIKEEDNSYLDKIIKEIKAMTEEDRNMFLKEVNKMNSFILENMTEETRNEFITEVNEMNNSVLRNKKCQEKKLTFQ